MKIVNNLICPAVCWYGATERQPDDRTSVPNRTVSTLENLAYLCACDLRCFCADDDQHPCDRSDALIVGASKLDRLLALCEHTETTSPTKMNAY